MSTGPDTNRFKPRGPAPVHLWNPASCGDIGLRIERDGSWHYAGSPIRRQSLVELFATILRKDEDGSHWLVTPVEKVPIAVADAPFLATGMEVEGQGNTQTLAFLTNVGDRVVAGEAHPLRFEIGVDGGFRPYVRVRARLEARLTRALAYDLAALASEEPAGRAGVWSAGRFFPLPEA